MELKGFEISAAAEIWAYTDAKGLANLFEELGTLNRPWTEEHSWVSIERDFSIFATCTPLGSATFRIELSGLQGASEEWEVRAGIQVEFGQLEQIARHAKTVFNERDA